jgi:hypothetical protein
MKPSPTSKTPFANIWWFATNCQGKGTLARSRSPADVPKLPGINHRDAVRALQRVGSAWRERARRSPDVRGRIAADCRMEPDDEQTTPLPSEFDTAVMGRKTYEVVTAQGGHGAMPGLDVVVFSRTLPAAAHRGVRIFNDDPGESDQSAAKQ